MLICHCKGVTERQIRELVRSGASSRSQVARACRASSYCGGCSPAIVRIIRDEQRRGDEQRQADVALAGVSVAAAAR